MRRLTAICLGLVLAGGALSVAGAKQSPLILVSIKPLYGLVASVMDGVGTPTLIFEKNPITRTRPMTRSEVALVVRARAVFWVGPELEGYLRSPLAQLKDTTRSIPLLHAPGVKLMDRIAERPLVAPRNEKAVPPSRKIVVRKTPDGRRTVIIQRSGAPAQVKRKPSPAAKRAAAPRTRPLTTKDLTPRNPDPHAWIDPRNAIAMARHVARRLGEIDPGNAAVYRRNLVRLIVKIETMDSEIRARVQAIPRGKYVTFGKTLQYFERHYLLSSAGRIGLDPRRIDRKVIQQARQRLSHENSRCIFASAGFDAKTRQAIGGRNSGIIVLDPYGLRHPVTQDHYFIVMRRLTDQFTGCVDPAQKTR